MANPAQEAKRIVSGTAIAATISEFSAYRGISTSSNARL
jgi:hypothetical protein